MWRKTGLVLLVGLCTRASLFSTKLFLRIDQPSPLSPSPEYRRHLSIKFPRGKDNPLRGRIHPWARHHLKPLDVPPQPSAETVSFWCIPKSGTSTVKAFYRCMDRTIANSKGAQKAWGHHEDEELVAFRPYGTNRTPSFVNVDTSSREGILRARDLGLVPSGLADIIFTGNPSFAVEQLYDPFHKGRILGLFRHPVDRLVSKFYYLQVADWETSYHPEWKGMSLMEFATEKASDNNHMVKKLSGKAWVTEEDLHFAMRTLKQRFIVGLMTQMEESIRRFNAVMGIDESDEKNKACMDQFFGSDVGDPGPFPFHGKKRNTNSHPTVEENSPEWKALAQNNALDIRLYDFIVQLFEEQKDTVHSYLGSMAAQEE